MQEPEMTSEDDVVVESLVVCYVAASVLACVWSDVMTRFADALEATQLTD
jgi:hypothetical protein